MNIIFIAPRYHTNQLSLMKKLIEEGHSVSFLAIDKGISESYQQVEPILIPISNLTKWYMKYWRKNLDFSKYADIAIPRINKYYKLIKELNPDVIVIRGATIPIYSKILIPYAKIKGIKLVFYTQGPKFVHSLKTVRKIHDWVITKILKIKWFTPVLFKGDKNSGLLELSYIEYIPFFIYPNEIETPKSVDAGLVNFLCVAKYEPRKNIALLVEVFAQLDKNYSNYCLTIIGSTGTDEREAYYNSIQLLVESSGLTDKITLLKNIPFEQMEYHYLSNQVFVLPSKGEPASVSQLEAMSYKLAIICSNDNGTAHYIKNLHNGYLVEASHNNLSLAIVSYLKDPKLAVLHGDESLRIIKSEFSISDNYRKFIKLIS